MRKQATLLNWPKVAQMEGDGREWGESRLCRAWSLYKLGVNGKKNRNTLLGIGDSGPFWWDTEVIVLGTFPDMLWLPALLEHSVASALSSYWATWWGGLSYELPRLPLDSRFAHSQILAGEASASCSVGGPQCSICVLTQPFVHIVSLDFNFPWSYSASLAMIKPCAVLVATEGWAISLSLVSQISAFQTAGCDSSAKTDRMKGGWKETGHPRWRFNAPPLRKWQNQAKKKIKNQYQKILNNIVKQFDLSDHKDSYKTSEQICFQVPVKYSSR